MTWSIYFAHFSITSQILSRLSVISGISGSSLKEVRILAFFASFKASNRSFGLGAKGSNLLEIFSLNVVIVIDMALFIFCSISMSLITILDLVVIITLKLFVLRILSISLVSSLSFSISG